MCIIVIASFTVDDIRYAAILDVRDADATTKCVPVCYLSDIAEKYGKKQGLANEHATETVVLANDNAYCPTQLAVRRGSDGVRLAALVDHRLHEESPMRTAKFGHERGQFCTQFATGTHSADAFAHQCAQQTKQWPHTLILWTSEGNGHVEVYVNDGCAVARESMDFSPPEIHISVIQTPSGVGDNPTTNARMIAAHNAIECCIKRFEDRAADGCARETAVEGFLSDALERLHDTSPPDANAPLLKLGKPVEYERHVESLRIPCRASFRDPRSVLSWMTRTTFVALFDGSRVHIKSRHYVVPDTVEGAALCANLFTESRTLVL